MGARALARVSVRKKKARSGRRDDGRRPATERLMRLRCLLRRIPPPHRPRPPPLGRVVVSPLRAGLGWRDAAPGLVSADRLALADTRGPSPRRVRPLHQSSAAAKKRPDARLFSSTEAVPAFLAVLRPQSAVADFTVSAPRYTLVGRAC